mmetsp:Transcript_18515/g.27078  ORF Transcript_18515/g.27078 Transcript_18515/m.27078 type:complete len:117 (+) Transcript_18515:583-933(+)
MDENTQSTSRNNKKPNAKDEDITSLVIFLSQRHTNGRLNKGATEEAMEHFPFKKSSFQSIWKKARPGVLDPSAKVDLTNKKKSRSGRKRDGKLPANLTCHAAVLDRTPPATTTSIA